MQQDLGLDRERARDAEPLLLAAREAERALFSRSLTSSHSAARFERVLDPVVEVVLHPERRAVPKATLSKIDLGNGFGF